MTDWFTSDLHFGHQALIDKGLRPFKNSRHMDISLIRNINSLVKEEDRLFILGDLTLSGPDRRDSIEKLIRKIRCKTKIFVLGNHDRLKSLTYVDMGFYQVVTHYELDHPNVDKTIYLIHDPAWAEIIPDSNPVFCGHVHRLFIVQKNVLNVGVDVHNYLPINLDTCIKLLGINKEMTNGKE